MDSYKDATDTSTVINFGTALEKAYPFGEYDEVKLLCLNIGRWPVAFEDPLSNVVTMYLFQLVLIIVVNRILVYLLKYLHQPRIVADIISGVILGPTLLARNQTYWKTVFPLSSLMTLIPMANIGIIYYTFLVGVEMNLSVIKRMGKKSIIIGLASVTVPFLVAFIATISLKNITLRTDRPVQFTREYKPSLQVLYLGVAFTVTTYSAVARILTELKLLNSAFGKMALSSAITADLCSWILLFVAILMGDETTEYTIAYWKVIICGVAFVLFCIFCCRPGIKYLLRLRKTSNGDHISLSFISFILAAVIFTSFLMDLIGIQPMFGAFVFGLSIPNGPLQIALIETLEDYVSGLLLPLYFLINGFRTNIWMISSANKRWKYLLGVIIVIFFAKLGVIALVAMFQNMRAREGTIIGLLLNTKGLVGIIILNIARDKKIFDAETFTILVFTMVATGAIACPLVMKLSQSAKSYSTYKTRTLQRISRTNAELRVLVCVHNPRNAQSAINLLESSNPTKASPMGVYALHLVELTDRASAMLVIHQPEKGNHVALNRTQAQSEHIVNAFRIYEQNTQSVFVQTLTAVSSYSTVHDDICNLAEDKRAAFIIIPFHKEKTVDGSMKVINPAFESINQNVLANAPCSVGILIDRGLVKVSNDNIHSQHIAMLFIGGPDDREALSYARRMAEHPDVSLTIYRFLPDEHADIPKQNYTQGAPLMLATNVEREKEIDDEFIREFRLKYVTNPSMVYTEMMVNDVNETVEAIRSIDDIHELYIVGRGNNMESELTAGLSEWSECPELGVIGDLLASTDFGGKMSILVVQQYIVVKTADGLETPRSNLSDQNLGFSRMSPPTMFSL
ncbi:hypothetical protein GIB67_026996 [Kingdonia uniflora]|uniref:Cation/H+ exchanger domain-containing protein n=1 Tax=Kingdonia uniflora TaxID=39325 RepID=A0A7J7P1J8_9MAGN|nr:hypothetical protein GIB67_026996 [Kingdonia uniflora]